ncbi:MAG: hypothetical protein SOR40_03350 [Rothia sp. (in: high G+C Gram-positive bacteria)]|nr:hypothetical protein [Rothia sp. (in: high G+C Gram-positive bacteria)]
MALRPTSSPRSPYLFHFEGQTVALGQALYLQRINDRLREQGYSTRPTYWDQAYLKEGQQGSLAWGQSRAEPEDPQQLNSVGVSCRSSEFWSALYARSFAAAAAQQGDTLYMPQLPSWLEQARAWEKIPFAPQEGPLPLEPAGCWVRVRGQDLAGQPLGLFQLESPDYFWAFGSGKDLKELLLLCRSLADRCAGFEQATAYLGYDLTYSSIRLPLACARPLQEELFFAGVDCETLFWEPA